MVAHLLFDLLGVSATFRHPIARALGSTNFTLVPGGTNRIGPHIFTGSRNFHRTAGTKAMIGPFGIDIVNPSSFFAVHKTF